MLRYVAVLLHRWVGLFMAVFLVVAGITGSVITFHQELDGLFCPQLRRTPMSSAGTATLAPEEMYEKLVAVLPDGARVAAIYLTPKVGHSAMFSVDPGDQTPDGDDEYFVDPHTGELLGSRRWGDLSQGSKNVIPFFYRLHYALALGDVGRVLLGVVALVWTLDCFVGAYLTFPAAGAPKPRRKSPLGIRRPTRWLARWGRAWGLRTSQLFSLVFSWHRASGLWVWGMLLMFAWSGVALNLYGEVYKPVMGAVFSMEDTFASVESRKKPNPTPGLSWAEALDRGEALLAEQARLQGFEVIAPERLRYFSGLGHFQYRARSTLDITAHQGQTAVWFDGTTGKISGLDLPTGKTSGATITTWLYALHFGNWAPGGIVYRIFVCVCGVLVALLSVTGVLIWWRKGSKHFARQLAGKEARPRFEVPAACEPGRGESSQKPGLAYDVRCAGGRSAASQRASGRGPFPFPGTTVRARIGRGNRT